MWAADITGIWREDIVGDSWKDAAGNCYEDADDARKMKAAREKYGPCMIGAHVRWRKAGKRTWLKPAQEYWHGRYAWGCRFEIPATMIYISHA